MLAPDAAHAQLGGLKRRLGEKVGKPKDVPAVRRDGGGGRGLWGPAGAAVAGPGSDQEGEGGHGQAGARTSGVTR
mgnify:CR=1 FL=1